MYADTCFTAQALVRLMVDLNEKTLEVMDHNHVNREPKFCDVVAVFKLLSSQLMDARELLEVRMSDFLYYVLNLFVWDNNYLIH